MARPTYWHGRKFNVKKLKLGMTTTRRDAQGARDIFEKV